MAYVNFKPVCNCGYIFKNFTYTSPPRKEMMRTINKHTKVDGTLDNDMVEILKEILFSHEQSHLTNGEKYAKDIIKFACFTSSFGFDKHEKKIKKYFDISCSDCLFDSRGGKSCIEQRKCWIDKEYASCIISKQDRMFLDYVDSKYKYMSKSQNGHVCFLQEINGYADFLVRCINIDFPMIEPGCKKPWKIEDLKQLQVVDNY